MKTFIISDTHFLHKNIIDYCNRPFDSVDEMTTKLIENWNSVVSGADIVWHLGDFTLARNKIQILEILNRLNGRIRLVRGNHDTLSNNDYRDCGFEEVYDKPIVIQNPFDTLYPILLSHSPIEFDSPFLNIHGHIHDKTMNLPNAINVSVEHINYTPKLLTTIIKEHINEVCN